MTPTDHTPEPDDTHRTDDRIDLRRTAEGVVMYDRENPDAWLEADRVVPLAERR